MRVVKGFYAIVICIAMFFSHPLSVRAAFELNDTTASYDSNSGILTINDTRFTKKDYSANVSKMRLGDTALIGAYDAKDGSIKIYLRNKNVVNQQASFTTTGAVVSGLHMGEGAIIHSYTPAGGINVTIDSPSYERNLTIDVVGLRPVMKIQDFKSDVTSIEGEGSVVITVIGENLDVASFSIYDQYTKTVHPMTVEKTKATIRLYRSVNLSSSSRTDTFSLYINEMDSMRSLNVTVYPKKQAPQEKPPETPQEKPSEEKPNTGNTPEKPPTSNETTGNSPSGGNTDSDSSINNNPQTGNNQPNNPNGSTSNSENVSNTKPNQENTSANTPTSGNSTSTPTSNPPKGATTILDKISQAIGTPPNNESVANKEDTKAQESVDETTNGEEPAELDTMETQKQEMTQELASKPMNTEEDTNMLLYGSIALLSIVGCLGAYKLYQKKQSMPKKS